ncbi:restriction endonuclease subunit S, partial [Vibrio anguillarum]|nr:restriction endonuclease subunit S [Vibrio anguillarum]
MKLKQIATINAGYPFRGKIPEVPGSAVVAVQMKDVSLTEGIRWSDCLETTLPGKRE